MLIGRSTLPIGFLAAAVCVLSGCTIGGSSSVGKENDRLRRENHELRVELEAVKSERDELRKNLSSGSSALAAELPRVVRLTIDGYSGLYPPNGELPARGVVFHLQPLDGRGRLIQAVGTLEVEARLESGLIARREISAQEWRDSYRSSFTGTHYTIEVPFDQPMARSGLGTLELELKATFTDAVDGSRIEAKRVVKR